VVDAAASPWGIKITRIEIKDIIPPADIVGAMGRQMKAERERRASILEAEGSRQSAILKAEGEKAAQILAAEGRKEAAFLDAEARERQANAEANATRALSDAIGKGDLGAVNYLIAEKYVSAFSKLATAPNQKVVIIPAEMSGFVGTLGGIAEIAKSALGGGDAPARTEAAKRPWSDPKAKE
jgi:regulator of protease activity HflC (stomatin/prohibitin superfamily)